MTRRILSLLGALAVLVMAAPPAGATGGGPSIDVDTEVSSASSGGCSAGNETWTVNVDVTVENTWEDGPITISGVDWDAKYSFGGGQIPQESVTVIDAGGLDAGASIPASTTQVFHAVVQLSLPCGVVFASVAPFITIDDRDKVYHEFDEFITNGTPVPAGVIGALAITALAGVGLAVTQRRRSRPMPVQIRA